MFFQKADYKDYQRQPEVLNMYVCKENVKEK